MLTYLLLLINSILYLGPTLLDGNLNGGGKNHWRIMDWGAERASAIQNGEFYRLISSNYLHWDLSHFILNMYSLYQIGPDLENLLGTSRFGIIYLLTGLSGGLTTYFLGPVFGQNPQIPSAGASGAIFGILGALIVFVASNPEKFQSGALPQLVIIALLNIAFGFYAQNIGNAAHIGGMVSGMLLGYLFTVIL